MYFLTSWQTSSGNLLRACLKSANTKWQSLVEKMSLELLEVAQERPPAEAFDAGPEKNRTESTGVNQSGHPLKWCGSKWNILCISYDWYDCVNVLISYIITWENKCFHNSTSISCHQTNLNLLLIIHAKRKSQQQKVQDSKYSKYKNPSDKSLQRNITWDTKMTKSMVDNPESSSTLSQHNVLGKQ